MNFRIRQSESDVSDVTHTVRHLRVNLEISNWKCMMNSYERCRQRQGLEILQPEMTRETEAC